MSALKPFNENNPVTLVITQPWWQSLKQTNKTKTKNTQKNEINKNDYNSLTEI